MKPLTAEWVRKAEEDFAGATQLNIPNLVCFHCQQCGEKYLKARLQEAELAFPKTHDLEELLDLVITVEPLWEALRAAASRLTDYASEFRYPGEDADASEAERARKLCRTIRETVRQDLGLTGGQPGLGVGEGKTRYRARRRKK